MNRRELANEFTRRYKKEPNKKQPLTRNEAGYKYRLYFIEEDLKNGINPYLGSSESLCSSQMSE